MIRHYAVQAYVKTGDEAPRILGTGVRRRDEQSLLPGRGLGTRRMGGREVHVRRLLAGTQEILPHREPNSDCAT